MLDRMAVTCPGWSEQHTADMGIMLVELLAYAADYLSYYQDAVATEAFLGTARLRTSVRRHARLLDYPMLDGANARAWICFTVAPESSHDGFTLPAQSQVATADTDNTASSSAHNPRSCIAAADQAYSGPIVFQTLHSVLLKSTRNEIPFYTWGDPACCLPKGAAHRPPCARGLPLIWRSKGQAMP